MSVLLCLDSAPFKWGNAVTIAAMSAYWPKRNASFISEGKNTTGFSSPLASNDYPQCRPLPLFHNRISTQSHSFKHRAHLACTDQQHLNEGDTTGNLLSCWPLADFTGGRYNTLRWYFSNRTTLLALTNCRFVQA